MSFILPSISYTLFFTRPYFLMTCLILISIYIFAVIQYTYLPTVYLAVFRYFCLSMIIFTLPQGQIKYRSRIENWHILWVTSPGDSTALSQCSYVWPAELRNLHSQTFILEMLPCHDFYQPFIFLNSIFFSISCELAVSVFLALYFHSSQFVCLYAQVECYLVNHIE